MPGTHRLFNKLAIANARVFTSSGDVTMLNEGALVVNKASGAATAVTLPANPKAGDFAFVKDGKGDASSNFITIAAAAGNIDGAASLVIREDYGAVLLMYNGTQWNVMDRHNAPGTVQTADVLVSSAELLALNATPKTLVAAPGSGKYLEFLGAHLFLDYNSAAYAADAGEDLCVKYTNASGDIVSTSIDGEEFEVTADALYVMTPVPTAPNVVTSAANAALVLHLLVGEWASGNSPLKVRVFYRTVSAAGLIAIA